MRSISIARPDLSLRTSAPGLACRRPDGTSGITRAAGRLEWLVLLAAAVLAHACATTSVRASDTAAIDHLLTLVVERLAVAPDVARTKWNTKAPIEDLGRERQIIAAVGAGAGAYGVPRDIAEGFFRAQIEASKVVQRALFSEFDATHRPPFPTVVDLDKEIRPTLDRLTPEMMRALGTALPVLQRKGGRRALDVHSRRFTVTAAGGGAAMQTAIASLREISR